MLLLLWIIFFIALFYFFLKLYSERNIVKTSHFIHLSKSLGPILIQDVKTRYWKVNDLHVSTNPKTRCDIYLFTHCIVVARHQSFFVDIIHPPILITSGTWDPHPAFNNMAAFRPGKILFKKILKGEIELACFNLLNDSYKLEITFKGLADYEVKQLEKIKTWT